MKRAVSISIGSSKRNKAVEIDLLGQRVSIERIGTDGDMEKAARLYEELDGKVDAFGVGGTDLGVMVDKKFYRLHSIKSMVRLVKKTPLVDGNGLKNTLEKRVAGVLDKAIGPYVESLGKRVFLVTGVDRWGMVEAFNKEGYALTFGDLMFNLGIPLALHTVPSIKTFAALLMPIAGRLPFHWLYPTGEKQEIRNPKFGKYFAWASVVAGDCHYIKRYMPDDLTGKVIVTNTTTPEDVEQFRKAGVKYLLTSTPVLSGRSFGTNMMEAALVAAAGISGPIDYDHPDAYFERMRCLVDEIGMQPQLQEL